MTLAEGEKPTHDGREKGKTKSRRGDVGDGGGELKNFCFKKLIQSSKISV
jgi:hypothetical protein